MLLSEIQIPVSRLTGAGEKTCQSLKKLKIITVSDLLSFYPRAWENRQVENTLGEFKSKYKIAVYLEVLGFDWFGFGKMKTLKIIVRDKNGQYAELVCFNRNFLKDNFPIGSKVFVYGHFEIKYGKLQSNNFEIEYEGKANKKILPVYSLTEGLSQKKIRSLVLQALKNYARGITSSLPKEICEQYKIPEKHQTLFFMHAPKSLDEVTIGTRAIIFEEFFLYQYALGLRSIAKRGRLPNEQVSATANNSKLTQKTYEEIQAKFLNSLCKMQKLLLDRLPFKLTCDQMTSIYECNFDLKKQNLISTLIQGDVGSGKTIVGFFVAVNIIEQGGQVAFLAPTELLAKQHAENAARLLEPLGVRLAFLTGNIKAKGRRQLLLALKEGDLDLVIGTHALFSKDIIYKNLKLAIIDEQHRFGVLQRQAIIQKGEESSPDKKSPHVIMMSATPIPRSLTLSIFGDMDVSLIKTKPLGRKPIITYVSKKTNVHKIYNFVKNEIIAGHQAYVVSPLIDEEGESELRSATEIFSNLKKFFPKFRLALLHSKIETEQQEKTMLSFKNGEIDILVATSIIEVGVDVPNATCIVIEQAERFGLAALHQLRGRVGRGEAQSYCFLVYGKNNANELTEKGVERLRILRDSNDGFEIAEKDLELRGPGDILGVAQSGYDLGFKLADPHRDFKILQEAMRAAFDLIRREKNISSL
ncbi:MAG: ATP-dependent DNA helicase RecG [Treponemataceae bacterium]